MGHGWLRRCWPTTSVALRDDDATEGDVVDWDSNGGVDDRIVAHDLLDRVRCYSGWLANRAHWSGLPARTWTAAASWLRVVSVPAVSIATASMRSSSCLS